MTLKYLVILNPHAGKKRKSTLVNKLVHGLEHVEVVKTQYKGHAMELAQGTNASVVIAAGGDGTVNEVINGVMRNRRKIVLGVLPLGTSNLCAKSLGMPVKNVGMILKTLLSGRRRAVDIGKIDDRFFVIGCGVGLDAHMYKNVEPNIKKFFGEVAYPLSLLKTMFNHDLQLLKVSAGRKEYFGYYALVCNIGNYTKFFRVIPDAKDDDGLLDLLLFKNKDILSQFKYLFSLLAKKHKENKDILHLRGKSFTITSREKVLAHADAELIGFTPVKISVKKQCLEVLV
jgi:diacylglycerol kinase (ATP)